MPITPSPYFAIPCRTGSSSTVSHQTARTTSDMSLQPWEPNPWKCMHNGCLPAAKRNRKQPRQKLLHSSTEYNRERHTTSTPMCILENSKILWPGQVRRGPLRSCCTHQDTDGLLQDDQWWASQEQTMLPYCPCILPWGKAPWETYGQAIQDTLQWAGWHCCKPLCHPTCPKTSLPHLQTCGCHPPGHHLHPPRTVPTAHNSTQLAEHTLLHMIPIAPNVTRWDTGNQNAMVASHSTHGMHLHLGHNKGSPDAHLGTTTTAMGGITKQTT